MNADGVEQLRLAALDAAHKDNILDAGGTGIALISVTLIGDHAKTLGDPRYTVKIINVNPRACDLGLLLTHIVRATHRVPRLAQDAALYFGCCEDPTPLKDWLAATAVVAMVLRL